MRAPLPTKAYDVHAVAASFADAEGASALRSRALFIAQTALRGIIAAAATAASPTPNAALAEAVDALGPTFIKFGQAAASRPDLVGIRAADSLRLLQDSCAPFSRAEAQRIIGEDLPPEVAAEVLGALPEMPAAAASIGQVYRLVLPSRSEPIALKILRPGVREVVAADAMLARGGARFLESLRWPPTSGGTRLIKPALVAGVDEFFQRLFEEMDYDVNCARAERAWPHAASGSASRPYRAPSSRRRDSPERTDAALVHKRAPSTRADRTSCAISTPLDACTAHKGQPHVRCAAPHASGAAVRAAALPASCCCRQRFRGGAVDAASR
jgi:hypothetical protein